MSRENARWLYLAQIGTEEFKIGVSLTPDWRARELQAHNKGWVRIARQWQFDDRAFLIESLV